MATETSEYPRVPEWMRPYIAGEHALDLGEYKFPGETCAYYVTRADFCPGIQYGKGKYLSSHAGYIEVGDILYVSVQVPEHYRSHVIFHEWYRAKQSVDDSRLTAFRVETPHVPLSEWYGYLRFRLSFFRDLAEHLAQPGPDGKAIDPEGAEDARRVVMAIGHML